MNNKHVFRTMVFTALMSLSVCSAAYASTVTRSSKVQSVSKYDDSFTTGRGTYIATGTSTTAKTSMASTSTQKLYGDIYTAEHNYNTGRYDFTSDIAVVVAHGDTVSRTHSRNKDSAVVDYIHSINMYYTSSKSSETLADSYNYTAMQYYR